MNLLQFTEISPLNSIDQPHPRSGHRAVATASDLWIWGGYHPSTSDLAPRTFNELWRFNFALQQWKLERTTGDGPTSTLASHSMALCRQFVFVFGGTGYPFGQTMSNELFVLDLKRLHWRKCQLNHEQPQQVYGASMIIKDDHLYILCGTNRWAYNTDVYDIHLSTLNCTRIGNTFNEIEDFFNEGRYRQEVYLHDNQIFLFGGGGSSGIAFSFENIPMFDLSTRRWSFVATSPDAVHNFPHARKFHSIFPFGENQVLMFGGAYFNHITADHALVDERLWLLDLKKFEWSILPSARMARSIYFHAAAMNDRGDIWTHGGVIDESDPVGNPARITTLFKMHTRVLNLSEIAWNSFLNCLKNRTCLVQQPKLVAELNIPARYAERIR